MGLKEENYIENDLKEIRSSKMWLIKSIFFSITNVLAAIIILGLPIASVAIDVMVRSEKNTEMIELYSIQIDNTISGSYTNFLVGHGTIKELRKTQIYDDKQELIKRKPERGRSR